MHPHTFHSFDFDEIEARITADFCPVRNFRHLSLRHDADTMARRLAAEAKDPTLFEAQWAVAFDTRFTAADYAVGKRALTRWVPPRPFLVTFEEAGAGAQGGLEVSCASSFEEAVAYLYQCCRLSSHYPDHLDLDLQAETLVMTLVGRPYASIGPIELETGPDSAAWIRRAKSTLVGFRKAADASHELHRRIASWPGLEALAPDPSTAIPRWRQDNGSMPHLPVPSEWLFSAKCLLEGVGLPASLEDQQRFVAAFFGAPSFNHLVGGVADQCGRFAGPWVVMEAKADGSAVQVFFADPFEAFCRWAKRLSVLIVGWGDPQLDESGSPETVFLLTASDGKWYEEGARYLQLGSVAPASIREEYATQIEAVRTALKSPELGLLSELFHADTVGLERARISSAARSVIATHHDGRRLYSFYLFDEGQYIACSRFDEMGNEVDVGSSGAALYKGTLVFEEAVDAWVLYSDYDCAHPVDAYRNLPPEVIKAVVSHLPESGKGLNTGGHITDSDKRHVLWILSR